MRTALSRNPQRGQSVEGGQRVVRENEVKAVLLQRPDERGFRFYARDGRSKTIGGERFLNKLRVPEVVLKVQDAQLSFHYGYCFLMLPGGGSLMTAQNTPSSLIAFTNSWKSTGLTT